MSPASLRTWVGLGIAAVAAAAFAACSSGNKGGNGAADSGADASVDGTDEGAQPDGGGGGPDDSAAAPEAIDLLSPDGCYRLGAYCMDNSTCCTQYCAEASCSVPVVKMIIERER